MSLTVAQAFNLHSRPNSPRKIFLDFDGHTTTGSAWNAVAGRPAVIITPPFDTVSLMCVVNNLSAGGCRSVLIEMALLHKT